MSIGSIMLRLRQRFGHGLRVAHARDVLRPRILKTSPIERTDDSTCEIHVMTSKEDWLNLIWALKSFYWASRRHYKLCIHEDGSVPIEGLREIKQHFPGARVIKRREADARVTVALASFPRCSQFRQTNILAPKLFDAREFLEADRMLLIDSDVLFFGHPAALISKIEDRNFRRNSFNSDLRSAYTIEPSVVKERLGFELCPKFNSGLGLVQKESLRWDWVEEFLSLPGLSEGYFWRIEQTLYALCSCRFGAELLPPPYSVYLDRGINGRPCRHYVGVIRHLMYGEGMTALARGGMLDDLRG